LAASEVGIDTFDEAFAKLVDLAAIGPVERHLIHSDLLNFNALVEGDRISAIFDWGCMLYGDFLYDPAWFAFWAPWYPAWRGIDFRAETVKHCAAIGLDVPHFDERFRACAIHIGLSNAAYSAYKGRWEQAGEVCHRALAIAQGTW
ncbi:MAG TPA: phosphotransferase, partial [Thermomicrobiales bacterium]|nr:phosphotransferase [Thermomicrobiales bacterium]